MAKNQKVRPCEAGKDRTNVEIERSRSLLQATLEATADGILAVDTRGRIVAYNQKFMEMWRIPEAVLATRDHDKFMSFILVQLRYPQGYANRVQEQFAHPEEESYDVLDLADGRVFERFAQPQLLGGEIVGRVVSFRDVTERRRATEALVHRVEMEKLIADLSNDFINLASEEISPGINRALEKVGRTVRVERIFVFRFSQDRRTLINSHEWCIPGFGATGASLKNLNASAFPWAMEKFARLESIVVLRGADLPPEAAPEKEILSSLGLRSCMAVPLARGEILLGILVLGSVREGKAWEEEDLALLSMMGEIFVNAWQRQEREEQLRLAQVQRMEAMDRLAGGVAHEFNNLLTAITGYSDLLLANFPRQDPLYRDIEEIKEAADRGAFLTRQLLAFSRRQVFQPKVLDLNGMLSKLESVLRPVLQEAIDLVMIPAPNLGRVMADPGQLEQVLLNLTVYARQAMAGGGKMILETADVDLDEAFVREHPEARSGPYVRLAVTDTGGGLDPETQAHLFEPFFARAEGEEGGLALSTVYGIVRQSGGFICVFSEPGQGTTFKIYLPRLAYAAPPPADLPDELPSLGGSETILLVEDEEMVRRATGRLLQRQGYKVLEAGRGAEAIQISGRHPGPIHLVLADVVMPGMSGKETVEALIPQRPELKVLYMSGYTENAIVRHGVLDPGITFLEKPFQPEVLMRTVRRLLDSPPPTA